jgi:(1->4)-alpha-D-glucan 1-alpha-D-glucosylmutase
VDVLADLESGLAKIWLISRVLGVRRHRPELFGVAGTYQPLPAQGSRAVHVVAFARGGEAVVVVPRLVSRLGALDADWADTTLALPPGRWRDELSDLSHEGGTVPLAQLLGTFPMALLLPDAL